VSVLPLRFKQLKVENSPHDVVLTQSTALKRLAPFVPNKSQIADPI